MKRSVRVTLDVRTILAAGVRGAIACDPSAIGSSWSLPTPRAAAAAYYDDDEDEDEEDEDDEERAAAGEARGTLGLPVEAPAGVAVVQVFGPLEQRSRWDLCAFVAGYDLVEALVGEALADESKGAIVLVIDSPGGVASGLTESVRRMRQAVAAAGKQVFCYVDESACSAAYGLATLAGDVTIPQTGRAGSIGAFVVHVDETASLEQAGLTPTLVASGARKADFSGLAPLSDEGRAKLQEVVDSARRELCALVSEGRPITAAAAQATEAEIFIGEKAVAAGLADRVGSIEDVFTLAAAAAEEFFMLKVKQQGASVAPAAPSGVAAAADAELGRAVRALVQSSNPNADAADLGAAIATINAWREQALAGAAAVAELAAQRATVDQARRLELGTKLAAMLGPGAVWARDESGDVRPANGLGEPYASLSVSQLESIVSSVGASPLAVAPPPGPAPKRATNPNEPNGGTFADGTLARRNVDGVLVSGGVKIDPAVEARAVAAASAALAAAGGHRR